MKQGWEIKKLGEICNKITNIKWNEIDKTTSFPYIDLSAVDREDSSIHDYEYINISNAPSRAKQIVKVGDILFATTRPMLKRACIIPNEFNNAIASTGFCVLRPQGAVLSEWIYHNIKSNRFYKYIEPIQKGVSYPAITDNEVKDFCIPVPSIEEQEKIVAELDCLSGVIEKKREQLKQLDALAQSIFYQMFGDPNNCIYETRNLSDLSEQKLSYGSGASAVDFDGKIRYVRITDIKDDGELQGDKVSPNVFDDRYTLNDGDILFARSGATVGKTYQYKQKDGKAIYAGYLIRFIPNRNIVLPSYIFGYTKTNYYKAFISASAQAVAQPNINAQQYGALKVPIPPLTLQQEFADKIEAIEKQKELIKQSITQTEELFNSRMSYYFN